MFLKNENQNVWYLRDRTTCTQYNIKYCPIETRKSFLLSRIDCDVRHTIRHYVVVRLSYLRTSYLFFLFLLQQTKFDCFAHAVVG